MHRSASRQRGHFGLRALAGRVCLLLALTGAPPGLASAQEAWVSEEDRAEARQLYEDAVELYGDGQLERAARTLERAYLLDPNPVLAYNIGKAYDEAGQFTDAKTWYLLALGSGDLGDVERKRAARAVERIDKTEAELRAAVDSLKPVEARLVVTSIPEGASVFVDGDAAGETPFSKVLTPGSYTIRVDAPRFESFSEVVELAAGDTVRVRAALTRPGLNTWVYISGGVAALALGAGIAGDVLATAAYEDAERARDKPARLEDLKRQGEGLQLLAVSGYSLAGAALVTGLVLLLIDQDDDEPAGYESLGAVRLGVSPLGATLQLRW